jgi:hypothetical protein
LAGRHEPSTGSSFYLSLATAALRAGLVVAALVLGVFVLSKAFPSSGGDLPTTTPGGGTTTESPTAAPTETGTEVTESPRVRETHDPSEVELQVLNATDTSGLAEDTANLLEEAGYQIRTFTNADTDPGQTTLFHRRGFKADAQALVEQYFPTGTLEEADPDLPVDISIVLSSDYEGASPTPEAT